jgi:hypothetical protein
MIVIVIAFIVFAIILLLLLLLLLLFIYYYYFPIFLVVTVVFYSIFLFYHPLCHAKISNFFFNFSLLFVSHSCKSRYPRFAPSWSRPVAM